MQPCLSRTLVVVLGAVLGAGSPRILAHPSLTPTSVQPSLLAISVTDLDSSSSWYGRILGFRPTDRRSFAEMGIDIQILEREGFRLELIRRRGSIARRPLLPDADDASIRGFCKLGFDVADFDVALEVLKSHAVRIAFGPRREPNGERWIIVRDPDDNLVQLFERPTASAPRR